MSKVESPEFTDANGKWPNIEVIKRLRGQKFIDEGSPLWWSTGYTPEPRELMPFEEFRVRLVHVGHVGVGWDDLRYVSRVTADDIEDLDDIDNVDEGEATRTRDVYLYPNPIVPMSILSLSIEGQTLPFVVTARPYHKKEVLSDPPTPFLNAYPSVEKVQHFSEAGGAISLYDHFYPHIRGLFGGSRGENYFWYPLSGNSDGKHIERALRRSLDEQGLSFFGLHHAAIIFGEWGSRHYANNWMELEKAPGLVDLKSLKGVDFAPQQVSAEELIKGYQEEDLTVDYPIHIEGFDNLWTLVIGSRTNAASRLRKPAVLGIHVNNGNGGWGGRAGIARIKDRALAEHISSAISDDFGIPVDTVLFTPQKGRPKYERVQAA